MNMESPVFTFTSPISLLEVNKVQENEAEKISYDNWGKVALAASEKLRKELEEKKVLYDEMKGRKRKLEELIDEKENTVKDNKQKLELKAKVIADKSSLIFAKEMAVAMIKSQIENEYKARSHLRADQELEEKRMRDLLDELKTLQKDLEELNKGIKEISDINDIVGKNSDLKNSMKDLLDLNNNMMKDVDGLKKTADEFENFLKNSIASKISWLECPVCLTTAEPPIFSCSKMHLICEECFDKLDEEAGYRSAECPVCRLRYYRVKSEIRHRPAENTWEEVKGLKEKLRILQETRTFKKD